MATPGESVRIVLKWFAIVGLVMLLMQLVPDGALANTPWNSLRNGKDETRSPLAPPADVPVIVSLDEAQEEAAEAPTGPLQGLEGGARNVTAPSPSPPHTHGLWRDKTQKGVLEGSGHATHTPHREEGAAPALLA